MTERRSYTDEQKAEALAMYPELGAHETSRRLGIPLGTCMSWAYRAGVKSHAGQTIAAATTVRVAMNEAWRAQMVEALDAVAELGSIRQLELLADEDAKLYEVTGAVTRAIHDRQLLSGEATARSEHLDGDARTKAAAILDELGAKRAEKGAA